MQDVRIIKKEGSYLWVVLLRKALKWRKSLHAIGTCAVLKYSCTKLNPASTRMLIHKVKASEILYTVESGEERKKLNK